MMRHFPKATVDRKSSLSNLAIHSVCQVLEGIEYAKTQTRFGRIRVQTRFHSLLSLFLSSFFPFLFDTKINDLCVTPSFPSPTQCNRLSRRKELSLFPSTIAKANRAFLLQSASEHQRERCYSLLSQLPTN